MFSYISSLYINPIMTEYISSFFDNLKQKTTNPLLGTIIFVTIIRYWDIVYAFFMFDDDCDFLYKKTYIHNYFSIKSFWKEISIIIFHAFLILMATYFLLTLSRFILNIYQKHLLSRTDKLTDKNSVKTTAEYENLEKNFVDIIVELKKSNDTLNHQEISISSYLNKISNQEKVKIELEATIIQIREHNSILQDDLKIKENLNLEEIRSLNERVVVISLDIEAEREKVEELRKLINIEENITNKIKDIYSKLENDALLNVFRILTSNLINEIEFSINNDIANDKLNDIQSLGLMRNLRPRNNLKMGQLTEIGRLINIYDRNLQSKVLD